MPLPIDLDYELLDSGRIDQGEGYKIERFGSLILERPARLASWPPLDPGLRLKATAAFDTKKGWSNPHSRSTKTQEITTLFTAPHAIRLNDLTLQLRLQDNGQVGIFPEHVTYFPILRTAVERLSGGISPTLLNLFGYTGMLTTAAISWGAQVTHVDTAKHALTTTRENVATNQLPSSSLRLIHEDAIAFVRRERQRGARYNIIVADPPNFSRLTAKKAWSLEDIILPFLRDLLALVEPGGTILITTHAPEWNATILENLLRSVGGTTVGDLSSGTLLLTGRTEAVLPLPAGFFCSATTS